jgi:hypothetical protein
MPLSVDDLDELDAICPPTPTAKNGYSDAERELLDELSASLDFSGAKETLQVLFQHPEREKTLQTLRTLLKNIAADPLAAKYRSVRLGNPKIQERLVSVPASIDFLKKLGFVEEAGVLTIAEDSVDQQAFSSMLRALEEVTLDGSSHDDFQQTGRKDAAAGLFYEDTAVAVLLVQQVFEHEIISTPQLQGEAIEYDAALDQLYSSVIGILTRITKAPKDRKYQRLNLDAKLLQGDPRCRLMLEAVGFLEEEGGGHLAIPLLDPCASSSSGSIFTFSEFDDDSAEGSEGGGGVALATLRACIAVLKMVRGVEGTGMRCGGVEALFENTMKDAAGAAAVVGQHLLGACAELDGGGHVLQLPVTVLKAAIETSTIPGSTAQMWLAFLGLSEVGAVY